MEECIQEKFDYKKVAKCSCSSNFHFQRVFSILCGYALGEYIKMRRLSLAGQELVTSEEKIVDISLKYGYDTPESFSRAFTKFHETSLSVAKHHAHIRSFSRFSVKLILFRGDIMCYRIEKKSAFKVICRLEQVAKPNPDYQCEIWVAVNSKLRSS